MENSTDANGFQGVLLALQQANRCSAKGEKRKERKREKLEEFEKCRAKQSEQVISNISPSLEHIKVYC